MAIAVLTASLCTFSWAVVSGVEYGFFYGVFHNPPSDGFAAHGPNYYQEHNVWYFKIVLSTLGFTVAKIFSDKVGTLVSIALVVNLVLFWNILSLSNRKF